MSSNPYLPPQTSELVDRRWPPNRIKNAVVAVATLAAIAIAIVLSLDPTKYFRYSHEAQANWEHPTLNVAVFCALFAAEGAFLA